MGANRDTWDILVIDGITKDNLAIKGCCRRMCAKKIECVTSAGIVIPAEQEWLEKFHMTSWSLEDYTNACQEPTFYDSIKSKQHNITT